MQFILTTNLVFYYKALLGNLHMLYKTCKVQAVEGSTRVEWNESASLFSGLIHMQLVFQQQDWEFAKSTADNKLSSKRPQRIDSEEHALFKHVPQLDRCLHVCHMY